jgi:hypothetical protein
MANKMLAASFALTSFLIYVPQSTNSALCSIIIKVETTRINLLALRTFADRDKPPNGTELSRCDRGGGIAEGASAGASG